MEQGQVAALQAALPYALAALALIGAARPIVRAISRFQAWLHETRRKAEDAEKASTKNGKDIDGLGAKVGKLTTRHVRLRDRVVRQGEDHQTLSGKFEASEKALPEILKNERHAIPDSPTGKLVASLDERVENLKEDHGRRLERVEEKTHDHGGKGA